MLEVMVLSYCRDHGIAASAATSTGRNLATAPRKQRQPSS
ncbi:hypothetical protein J2W36_002804 [Variovorax ginsengisoli]|uniref:Uncharacterized protein n=1 Tax=Variovorax ginsengisoli TaxID=363844 RepID=A0ABT9S865_9BURK|nr:hypothetical protein [Variovorax ginsengisoli]